MRDVDSQAIPGLRGQTVMSSYDFLATGTDVLHRQACNPNTMSSAPTAIAVTQTVALVAGHVLAVIAAHDRALGPYANRAIASQSTDAATGDHLIGRASRRPLGRPARPPRRLRGSTIVPLAPPQVRGPVPPDRQGFCHSVQQRSTATGLICPPRPGSRRAASTPSR